MATHTVAHSAHGTITPGQADAVVLGNQFNSVEIYNLDQDTGRLYVRHDGGTPAVGGDDTDVVLPNEVIVVGPTAVVRLISATAVEWHVSGRT